jgi:hypothetical protein
MAARFIKFTIEILNDRSGPHGNRAKDYIAKYQFDLVGNRRFVCRELRGRD